VNQLRRPLVVALLAFLAGLLLALRFETPVLLPVAVLLTSLVAVTFTDSKMSRAGVLWRGRSLLILLAGSGATVGALAKSDAILDCRASFQDDASLEIRGTLAAAVRTVPAGEVAPRVPLIATEVNGSPACAGEIRIRPAAVEIELAAGTRVIAAGRWRTFPTELDGDLWPRDPRFHGSLLAESLAAIDDDFPASSFWLRVRGAADERLAKIFPNHLPLAEGLLLGRREYVDRDVLDRYTRSGLTHLLAISGMHVGLLATVLLLVASAARTSRRRGVYLTLVATWVYLLVIGAPASALRAGAMISLALLAYLLQRPAAATTIVAAAAFAILAFQPLAILDPGFQLSFAGVLGILLLRAPLLTIAPDQLLARGLLRGVTEAFMVGLAAFLVTAPIVAHHFEVVAPISIISGLPAIPLTSIALIGVAAALALDPLLPPIAALLAAGAGAALDALDWIAAFSADLPYGNGPIARPPWWTWTVAGAGGLAAVRWNRDRGKRLRWITGVGAALTVLVIWPLLPLDRADGLEVHFLDVGQGDAIAIKTPEGRWIVVDTGPASADFNAGERRVVPFLRSQGVRRLEALILTHPDLDHIGGAAALLSAIPVNFVFEPGMAVGRSAYLDFLRAVEREGTQWRAARAGRSMELDGVRVDFLWPDPETVDGAIDANQISAVMRVSYGAFALLLTGDAGTDVEQLLVARHEDALRSSILKLGHHGSETSTADALLDVVRPDLAVVSAGRRNRYGHPAPSVMERVVTRQIPVARTDQEGTVSILVSEGGSHWRRKE